MYRHLRARLHRRSAGDRPGYRPVPGRRPATRRLRAHPASALLVSALLLTGCASSVAGNPEPAPATVTVTESAPETDAITESEESEQTEDTSTEDTEPAIRTDSLTPPDPCSLLTQDEADQLAGRPLQAPVSSGAEGQPVMCQFTSDPNEPSIAQVTVQVGDGVEKYLEIDRDTLGHEFTQLSDLGDEAWQEDDAIFVRVGSQWFSITLVLLNDPAENVEPIKAAATIAAGRVQP